MKTTTKLILAGVLLLLPILARVLWFHRGVYDPPEPARLEDLQINLPQADYNPLTDRPAPGSGRVVFDLAHGNHLQIDDLTPLQNRLAERRVEVTILTDPTSLAGALRGATAYVVAAPSIPFDRQERETVQAFVADGGKLLILADPTRPIPFPEDEFIDLSTLFFPESAVPVVNSLANVFGVSYYDDYLYNLESNQGNYRNISISDFGADPALTRGVDTLVLFAAHSLRGGEPLLTSDENTRSNKRTGEERFSPGVLAADGNVLALGDLTLLTAPYHTVAGNDRFLSNLADWLAQDRRAWSLADFPYLYDGAVEFIQLKDGDFDPRLLVFGSALQAHLEAAGLELVATDVVSPTQDALLAGTYLEHQAVAGLLQTAGITVTLTFSPTAEGLPPTLDELQNGQLDIAGLGQLDVRGATLYVEHPLGEDETALVVLAYDEPSLIVALENLLSGLPADCLTQGALAVCSTGELNQPAPGGEPAPTATPPAGGSQPPADAPAVFILALDAGPTGVRTSADDLQRILSPYYNVTVWSLLQNGAPTSADVAGYDLYLIDAGDYAFDFDSFEALDALNAVEAPSFFIGAQLFPAFETEPLVDVAVAAPGHPVVAGLPEVPILLSESLSGVPEQLFRAEDFDPESETVAVLFTRGPGNATPGGPVILSVEEAPEQRTVLAALPWYRLPPDVQETLALNVVRWLLGDL